MIDLFGKSNTIPGVYFLLVRSSFIGWIVWAATPAVCALWAVRLARLRLTASYRFLFIYLVTEGGLNLIGMPLYFTAEHTYFYVWFWLVSRMISFVLLLCVLIEVYQRLVMNYPGFQRLGRAVLYLSLAAAAVFAVGLLVMDSPDRLRTMRDLVVVRERSIFTALATLAVLLAGFAAYFHLRPPRNVLVLFGVFGTCFVLQALLWTLRNFLGGWFRPVRDIAAVVIYLACISFGAVAFSSEQGGGPTMADGPGTSGQDDPAAVRRLKALNENLLGVYLP